MLICAGFVLGGLFGSRFAVQLPELILQRIFGISLLVIAIRMIFAR